MFKFQNSKIRSQSLEINVRILQKFWLSFSNTWKNVTKKQIIKNKYFEKIIKVYKNSDFDSNKIRIIFFSHTKKKTFENKIIFKICSVLFHFVLKKIFIHVALFLFRTWAPSSLRHLRIPLQQPVQTKEHFWYK